jgi:hypothetical protein
MAKLIFFHAKSIARGQTPFKGKTNLEVMGYGKSIKPYTIDTSVLSNKIFAITNPDGEYLSNEWIADELNCSSIRQPEVTKLIKDSVPPAGFLPWVYQEDDGSMDDGFPARKFVDSYFVSEADCNKVVGILNKKFTAMATREAKRENKTLEQVVKELGAELEA